MIPRWSHYLNSVLIGAALGGGLYLNENGMPSTAAPLLIVALIGVAIILFGERHNASV